MGTAESIHQAESSGHRYTGEVSNVGKGVGGRAMAVMYNIEVSEDVTPRAGAEAVYTWYTLQPCSITKGASAIAMTASGSMGVAAFARWRWRLPAVGQRIGKIYTSRPCAGQRSTMG